MIQILKSNNPALVLVFLLYTFILGFALFFEPSPATHLPGDVLANSIIDFLLSLALYPEVLATLSILLIFIQAIIINSVANRFKIFNATTHIPGVMYILMASLFVDYLILDSLLFVNFIIIFFVSGIFSLYHTKTCYSRAYDLGLLAALASAIYFPAIALLPALIVAIMVMRAFNWREWASAFLGFITIYFLIFTILFVTDNLQWLTQLPQNIPMQFTLPGTESIRIIVLGIFILLLCAGAVIILQNNFLKSLIHQRKAFMVTIHLSLLLILSFLLIPQIQLAHFAILNVPFSILLSYFFLNVKNKKAAETLHITLLILILWFQYDRFLNIY